MTRSAVPGYFASAAVLALVAAVPVTAVPRPGGAPWAAEAAAALVVVAASVPDEPHAARRPVTATAATTPAAVAA
jgi:hypothetical protein